MKRAIVYSSGILLLTGVCLTFGSCKKDSKEQPPLPLAGIAIIHAAPKVGSFEVFVAGKKVSQKISYASHSGGPGTPYLPVAASANTFKLVIDPATVIAEDKLALKADKGYSLVAYDTLPKTGGAKVKYTLLEDDLSAPATGKTHIRFLHLSPNLPPVNVVLYKGTDSIVLTSAPAAYVGSLPVTADLAKFKAVNSGSYKLKVKSKDFTTTILEIAAVDMAAQRIFTMYLKGVAGESGVHAPGIQLVQHK